MRLKQSKPIKQLVAAFLKLGALSYGGGAMMGIMYEEIARTRQWLTDARYLEGVSLVSTLPGPPAVQLAIFIGYERAGWLGGIVAGICFMLPAFIVLLGLTLLYSTYGTVGPIQDALRGIGAAVVGIFAAAMFRLSKSALKDRAEVAIAIAAAIAVATTPVGIATILLLGACAGVALHNSLSRGLAGAVAICGLATCLYLMQPLVFGAASASAYHSGDPNQPTLWQLAAFFLKVSALTFGGGLAILSFVQEHVVNEMHWLTAREFLDGLALGQLTPGPTLMIAAYIGYKLAGLMGAVVSASCIFAPAFFLLLPLLPILQRFQNVLWLKAAMRGVTPAVIGCLFTTLAQLLPHAAPDVFGWVILVSTGVALIRWNLPPLTLILGAGIVGIVGGYALV